jgi:hypothetical protein
MRLRTMANGAAIPLAELPCLSVDALRAAVLGARGRGRRVSALFAAPHGDALRLYLVLADDDDGVLECACAELDGATFPSMAAECPEVQLFEREIAEQWDVLPEGHPWLKPVRFQRSRRAVGGGPAPLCGVTDFFRVEGDEIHEVAVGTPASATRRPTARSSRRSAAAARRRAALRCAGWPWSSSGSPTTPATSAPSPATSASCRPPTTTAACAATS